MAIFNTSLASKLIGADIQSVERYGSGHIHQTYKVEASSGEVYILQKINCKIFTNIPVLQKNIQNVLNHIAQKGQSDNSLKILTFKNEKSYFLDDLGNYWRLFNYIHNSKTYNKITSENLAYEAGKAYGSFLSSLNDLPVDSLHETIPDFHNLDYRLHLLEQSVKTDTKNRLSNIESELQFARIRSLKLRRILELGKENKIPLRVTHNDTKINNVLFNKDDKAICVIDLDTVMPGYIHYDFGDAIRTGAASADEDEAELCKMFIDLELFESYSKGFLEQTVEFLNQTEIDELYFAPQLLTFIIALRFLTDYLNGDVYFKIDHEKHNLQRWYAQKQLLLSMEENESEMQQIIKKIEKDLKNKS